MSPVQTFLRDREPFRMRGAAAVALTDELVVQSMGGSSDSGGGVSGAWSGGGTFPCRIAPLGGPGSRLVGQRVDERSTHIVFAPAGAVTDPGQRAVVAGRGTFEVLAVHERTSAWLTGFEVIRV